jgi:hypothetical protein
MKTLILWDPSDFAQEEADRRLSSLSFIAAGNEGLEHSRLSRLLLQDLQNFA